MPLATGADGISYWCLLVQVSEDWSQVDDWFEADGWLNYLHIRHFCLLLFSGANETGVKLKNGRVLAILITILQWRLCYNCLEALIWTMLSSEWECWQYSGQRLKWVREFPNLMKLNRSVSRRLNAAVAFVYGRV